MGKPRRDLQGAGILLILAALSANPWALGSFLRLPADLQGKRFLLAILAAEALMLLGGAWLVAGARLRRVAVPAVALAAAVLLAAGGWGALQGAGRAPAPRASATASAAPDLEALDASEDVYERTEMAVQALAPALQDLAFPGLAAPRVFAPSVEVKDASVRPEVLEPERFGPVEVKRLRWGSAEAARAVPVDRLDLLAPALDRFAEVEWTRVHEVDSGFVEGKPELWKTLLKVQCAGRSSGGSRLALKAQVDVVWEVRGEGQDRIRSWALKSADLLEAPGDLFPDVAGSILADPEARSRLRTEPAEERLRLMLEDSDQPRNGKLALEIARTFDSQDPRGRGVAVADLDGDGWDDLFLARVLGPPMVLRNRGDGTFEEATSRMGLDRVRDVGCALFADFDNDGDPDGVTGMKNGRVRYLENAGGRFVDRTDSVLPTPVFRVVSLSAADYDGDGRLDLYASTLGNPGGLEESSGVKFPVARGNELTSRVEGREDPEIRRLGPPNVLLRNRGGQLVLAEEAAEAFVRASTHHSAWCDYDRDGDPDLYVANDLGPCSLLRNDGEGRFTDVTDAVTAGTGTSMGASWGDYDEDGRPDLYVSAMYSSAGKRITRDVEGEEEALAGQSRGNLLLRNTPAGMALVSGTKPPALEVENAGWSYGSQFVDLDRDGWLDLYAPNGFYTPPPGVEPAPDL